jgi:hypothetical protein
MNVFNNQQSSENYQRIDGSDVSPWKNLYRIGGFGALIAGLLTLLDVVVFAVWPQPTTINGWFTLFQSNWFIGLLDLDFFGIIAYVLLFPTLLALYIALRRASQSWMAIGTTLAFVGMAVYFASNTAFSMLSLSNQYAAATTDAQRSMFLAAGQAMIAIFFGPAFTESYILVSAALLIVSVVMIRANIFSKKTASVGIVATLAGLAEYVPVQATSLPLTFMNALFLGIWFVLIGRGLYQLGCKEENARERSLNS